MFLHLGGNVDILNQEIIVILNYKTLKRNTAELPSFFNSAKMIHIEPDKEIKSVILTQEEIFLSPISSWTLLKRSELKDPIKGVAYVQ